MAEPQDYDVRDFAMILNQLPDWMPISKAYHFAPGTISNWTYSCEREHMVDWFLSQATNGGGSYTRDNPNRSAKRTYNRLSNSGSILWINEALGADRERVKEAAHAAGEVTDHRARCKIVREYFPWDSVLELVNQYLLNNPNQKPVSRNRKMTRMARDARRRK
ncbi:hypothetical protein [Arcanobacterium bovis]|uniref:Uncharacterized protein n=1 Tax=Arcanobacterium bovis TaxID=2529275 RepID=A0A4Q9V1E4_9ACTO|nr:hypothetical protein [Arcanobacterium bovis]TBW22901.1 hypothetical protein EZJ44_03115 [Arcanobacterium bovis]